MDEFQVLHGSIQKLERRIEKVEEKTHKFDLMLSRMETLFGSKKPKKLSALEKRQITATVVSIVAVLGGKELIITLFQFIQSLLQGGSL